MSVIGIDLGVKEGGLAVMAPARPMPVVVYTERLHNLDLHRLQQAVWQAAKRFGARAIACEQPGHYGRRTIGMAQRERKGILAAISAQLELPKWRDGKGRRRQQPIEIQPQSVKKAVTGRGRAGKESMAYHLRRQLGRFPHDDDEHVVDAVAIALTALTRREGAAARKRAERPSRRKVTA